MSNRPSPAKIGWHQGQCGWSGFRLALLGGVAVAGWGADTTARAQTAPNLILPDGRTRTQLSVTGSTTGITTGTVAGANAFNSFSQFKVGAGRTVNLVVPTGAQNLLNLVRDGQTVVDGTLNGTQGGRVGGNIFFADPYGFLVGPTGTINTGSLTVSTPTKAFIDRLLPSPNQPDANATAMLLADTMPVSPDGVVVVRGRINAQGKVKLHGNSVTVAAAPDPRKVFDASVNTDGIRRGGSIVVSNGEIDIVAEGAVEVAGELRADGTSGVAGGSISVASGADTHVAPTARLSARGVGVASRGGTVKFKAGHNLVVADGAAVNVSGGTTGDGGHLELSAIATASVGALVLDAGSNGGAAGSLLIDPTDLVIGSAAGNTASMDTGGVAATLVADHSITIDGYVNTRKTGHAGNDTSSASTGNSGNITLTAPTITVNGSLNAGVVGGGGFAAGTILLDAQASNTVSSGVATSNASIVVNGRIVGGNVTLQSIATASASYNVLEKVLNSAVANGKFSGILLNALVAEANAGVAVNANAVIVSSGAVVIAASGTQTASTGSVISIAPDPAKAGTGNNAGFAALYGSTTGVVSATVLGSVTAAGDLTVSAHDTAKIELNLKATSATSSGNSFGGVVGVAYANLATTASVGGGATVAAGNLNVVARNDDSWSNTASVTLLASGSGGAGSVAVNDISTGATAHLGASLAAGSVGNVLVEADSITALDLASSSSTVKQQAAGGGGGTPDPDPIPTGTGGAGTAGIVTGLIGTGSASGAGGKDPAGASGSTVRVAADFTLAIEHQTATANIAADAGKAAPAVHAAGSVAVLSQLVDAGVWDGATSAQKVQKSADGTSPTGQADGITAALNLSFLTNASNAYVGAGSTVSGTDVGVAGSLNMPLNNATFACVTSSCSLTDTLSQLKADATLDKHLNSYVSSQGTATDKSVAGAVDVFEVANTASAIVGNDATIASTASGNAAWNTVQDNGTAFAPATPVNVVWDAPVSVKASMLTLTASMAGDACGTYTCFTAGTGSSTNKGSAAGGSLSYISYNDTTVAEVGAGASITAAGAVVVNANDRDFLLGLIVNSGKGGANELSGIVAINELNNRTHAAISNTAYVSAATVAVTAREDLTVWAATGEIVSANAASFGLSVAISNLDTDTEAFVGDDNADLASLMPASPGGLVAAPLAEIATGSLTVLATTAGSAGAVSLAASAVSSTDKKDDSASTTPAAPSKFDSVRSALGGALGKVGGGAYSGMVSPGSNPPEPPAQPKYGIGVSGSSSVLLTALGTRAYLHGATVTGIPGVANYSHVQALDGVTMVATSGAAAVVSANASSSKRSAAIAGTVAFLQNDDETLAYVDGGSNLTLNSITVAAMVAGTEVAAGLGVSVNTSDNTDSSLSLAGSVSVMLVEQATNASISDSTLTAAAGTAGSVTVNAYSAAKYGIGGGAVALGKGDAVGATITFLEVDDPTQSGADTGHAIDARVVGSTLASFGAVAVYAGDAQKAAAGALMVAASTKGDAFGGAAVINLLNDTTSAEIVGGSTLSSVGSAFVGADGRDRTPLDAIVANLGTLGSTDVAYDFNDVNGGVGVGDGASVVAVAGALSGGKTGASAGFAVLVDEINQTRSAVVSGSTVTIASAATDASCAAATGAGCVVVHADDVDGILGIAAGVAVSGGTLSLAGSIAVAEANNTVVARIGDAAATTATTSIGSPSVTVSAVNNATIGSFAGSVALSKGTAIGAAVGYDKVGGSTDAEVDRTALTGVNALSVTADETGLVEAIAVAGAGGKSGAIAGSVTANQTTSAVTAALDDSTMSGAATVNVAAHDRTTIQSLAGALAGSGDTSVGAAVAVNLVGDKVLAQVLGGTLGVKDATVSAAASGLIQTLAVGVAASGEVAVAGSVATNVMTEAVTAQIAGGADVTAANNVAILAGNTDSVAVIAGAAGIGLSTAGIGLSVVVNQSTDTTRALIDGATTKVDANGGDASDALQVASGNLASPIDVSSIQAPSASTPSLAETTTNVVGLAVVATSDQATVANAVTLGLAFDPVSAGVSANVVTNLLGGSTEAAITNAAVDTRLAADPTAAGFVAPQLAVTAASHQYAGNFVVSVATGGFAGVAAVAATRETRNTTAHVTGATIGTLFQKSQVTTRYAFVPAPDGQIGDGTPLTHTVLTLLPVLGDVSVTAVSSQDNASIVAGLAAGLVSLAGSSAVNTFSPDTEASVDQGSLVARALAVAATSENGYNGLVGAGAVGGTGIAAAIGVDSIQDVTRATVGDTTHATLVQLAGGLTDQATTTDTLNALLVSGAAAGGVGLAGMVDVTTIKNFTVAGLYGVNLNPAATPVATTDGSGNTTVDNTGGGHLGTPSGDVLVAAAETVAVNAFGGALAGGGEVGGGASANAVLLQSATQAEIDGGTINAAGSGVHVSANSAKSVNSVAATGAVGGSAGVSGTVGVILVGQGSEGDGAGAIASALTQANAVSNGGGQSGGDPSLAAPGTLDTATSYNLTAALGAGSTDTVIAAISGGAVVAASVSATATAGVSTSNTAAAVAIGGAVGLGGGVAFTRIYDNVAASVAQASITAGSVSVAASMGDGTGGAAGTTKAYAAGGGVVGIGAGVADAVVDNTVFAGLGSATGTDKGAASVTATDTSSLSSTTVGGALGAVAVGVMVANADKTSTVAASLSRPVGGVATTLSGFRGVSILASGGGSVTASATGASGGLILAANAAAATASDTETISASVAAGDTISIARGQVYLSATDSPDVGASAFGVSVSAAYALGASVALATATPNVTATVGDGANISGAGGLGLDAEVTPVPGADSNTTAAVATAGSGAVLASAAAAVATATDGGTVQATIGRNVTLPDDDVSVVARNLTAEDATATGVSVGGVLAVGAAVADAYGGTAGNPLTTSANVGDGSAFAAGRGGALSIQALGNALVQASATAGSGGLFAGSAASAEADGYANTAAGLAGGTALDVIDAGSVSVTAAHVASFAATTDSTNAAVLGASGAISNSNVTSNVATTIGPNLDVVSPGAVLVSATNTFDDVGSGARGAAGGVFSGSAALSQVSLHGEVNSVDVGAGTSLVSGTDPTDNPGQLEIAAATIVSGSDTVSLSTGGGIAVAVVRSDTTASIANTATLGANDVLQGHGNVGVGTYALAEGVGNNALVSTWGLAAVGAAHASTTVNVVQSVGVGAGATIEGDGQVNVTAGYDPAGYYSTSVALNPVAQGYVRGLIAVPVADATANSNSVATLTVGAGAKILAGENVKLGAYSGAIDNTPSGKGNGYELGFIPVTDGSSNSNTSRASSLVNNGTVLAGRYNNITLNIANCADDGPFCTTATQTGGLTQAVWTYSTLNPVDFIAAHWSGVDQQLLDGGVTNAPAGAITLGNLFASGGVVVVNADTISGTGSITANGSPAVKVINASPDTLVFGAVTIPNTLAGSVLFTGRADQAHATGQTITQAGSSSVPSVDVENTYQGSPGPALFQVGDVVNLGGSVKLFNASGSYGAKGAVYASSVDISAPQGSVAINVPNPPGLAIIGGLPSTEWKDYAIFPGGNPATSLPDGNFGAAYLANASSPVAGTTNSDTLNNALIGTAGGKQQVSSVFFGSCSPAALGTDCGAGYANSLSPAHDNWHLTNDFYFPRVPTEVLTISVATPSAQQTGASAANPGISGTRVAVTAAYIDINGQVNVGPPTSWSVDLPASLTAPGVPGFPTITGGAVWQDQYAFDHGLVANPVFTLSGLAGIANGDSVIPVTYNAQTQQLVMANVVASAGGAYLLLDGKIISTNSLGNIHVNGGQGKVNVTNETADTLAVQNVFAGTNANTAAANSKVEIIDEARDAASNHTWYVYTPGGGINEYQGAAGATLANAGLVAALGASTTYNPVAGLAYQWAEQATLHRNVDFTRNSNNNVTGLSASGWQFNSGATNDPWVYVRAADVANTGSKSYSTSTTPQGVVTTGNTSTAAFTETITGGVSANQGLTVGYHGCGGSVGDGCNYGFRRTGVDWNNAGASLWQYNYVTDGWLRLNFKVRADNPFGISFSGGKLGGVAVSSVGSLALSGQVANPSGTVALASSAGDILQSANALITTNQLTLRAAGAIGGVAQPIQALITGGGLVNATGGVAGVALKLQSGAIVGSIAAGDAVHGYGDVLVTAAGDLQPLAGQPAGTVNVAGRGINLASQGAVGTTAAPMVVQSHRSGLSGEVDVSALNSIHVDQPTGDMVVGAIASLNGDVVLNVPGGAVLDSSQATPASVLNAKQVASIWSTLHLTAATGSVANADATSVAPVQAMVNANYRQYWLLLGGGSVSGGVVTLSAHGLDLYRVQAAGSLGAATATDAQVQNFANALYGKLTGSFASNLGAGWQSTPDFAAQNANFAYTLSAAQVTALEQGGSWTDSQLLNVISLTALQPSANSTVGIGTPNVSGHNVTVNAGGSGSGGVGQLAGAVNLTLQQIKDGTLSDTQKAALALAHTPGEISIYGTGANGNPITIPVGALSAADTVLGINIRQVAPLFVNAPGVFNASSGSMLFVQATNNDLTIGKLTAAGEVTLTAPEAILSAGLASPQLTINGTGNLTLLAGTGGIGTAAAPLVVSIGTNELSSATAAGDITLTATGADLLVGRVSGGGTVALTARDGGVQATLPGIAVLAGNANLVASGDVGSLALPFGVTVTGELDGSAGGAATLHSNAALTVGTFSADKGLLLTTDTDLVATSLRAAHGPVTVASGGNATLLAVTSGGTMGLSAAGSLTLGNLTSGGALVGNAGGALELLPTSVASSAATLAFTAASIDVGGSAEVVRARGDILLRADAVTLGAAISSPTMVTLEPLTDGTAITVGTGNAGLVIGTAGANKIVTPLLVVGDATAGGITLNKPFTLPATTTTLELLSAGGVTQTPGSAISVNGLAIGAASATLNEANQVATLAAAVPGTLALTDARALSIGTAGPYAGVVAGTLVLTDKVSVTQTQAVRVAGLDALGAGGRYALTGLGNTVATLAGNTGSVSLVDGAPLSIGTVGGTVGLTAATVVLTDATTIGQTQAITAGGLDLLGTGGVDTLTNTGNAVGTLAGNTGAISLFDTVNLSIGTVGTTAGVTATTLVLNDQKVVTQSQAVRVGGLDLLGAGGTYALTTPTNAVATLAGNTGSVTLTAAAALSIGTVAGTVGLTANTVVLSDATTIGQTQAIVAGGLDLLGAGGVATLNNAGNAVGVLAGNTGTISLTDSANLSIGTVGGTAGVTATSLVLTDRNAVTQTQAVHVAGLDVLGAGGSYTLTTPANTVATLAGNTGSVSLTDAAALSIGTVGATVGLTAGTVVLTDATSITQTQALTAGALDLLGAGGVDTLTNAGNAVGVLAGNTGSVSLVDTTNLSIGTVGGTAGVTATTLVINDRKGVAQTQAVTVAGLDLLGAGGSYTLTLPTNAVATLAGNTGSVALTDAVALSIGTVGGTVGLTAGTVALSDALAITQTQALVVGGLDLLGGGPVTLTHPTNAVAVLAGNTGPVTLTDATNLSIGTVAGTVGLTTPTLVLTDGKVVTQTQAITAGGIDLLGAGGQYVLTLPSNKVGVVAANTGVVNLTDGAPLSVGSVAGTTGITATGNVTLTSDRITFAGDALIYAPGQTVTLQPLTDGSPITLGNNGSGFSFNEANLDAVTAALLVVGNTRAGDVTINTGINPAHVPSLALLSGGAVNAVGGSSVTVRNLAVIGLKSISLPWGNSVGQVAMRGGTIDFADQVNVVVGTVAGVVGINGTTVRLSDNGTTTQTAAVVAGGLDLLNSASTYLLTLPGNQVQVLAGNAGTVNLADGVNLSIGSVAGTTGLQANTVILTDAKTVTQTASLNVGGLDLLGAGGTYTLTAGNNRVGTLAGNTGRISLTDQADLVIGTVGPTTGVTATSLTLKVAGTTSQTAPLNVSQLLLGGGGNYQLTNAQNVIGTLASNATGTVSVTDSTNLAIGPVGGVSGVTAQTLVLNDTGTVTGAAPIVAAQVLLLGQGGTYVLTNAGNAVGTLAGDTGNVTLTQNAALSIGVAGGLNGLRANTLTVSDNVSMSQTQPLWLTALDLLGAGNFSLTNGANRIATLAANLSPLTGTLTLANASDLVIGAVGATRGIVANTLAITENGVVTQTQAISVGNLALVGGGGTFHLTGPGNTIGVLAGNSSQTIDVAAVGNVVIGTVAGTVGITVPDFWLNVPGTVTQSATISVNALALRGGTDLLTMAGNRVANLAANVAALDLWTGSNVLVTGVNGLTGVNATTATFNVAGVLSQDQAVIAGQLLLLGGNSTTVLNNAGNQVATLAGNTGSVSLTDGVALTIGAVGGVAGLTAHDVTLTDGVGVTEAAPITAVTLTLLGGGNDHLSAAGNAVGNLGGTVSALDFTQAGGFNLNATTAAHLTLNSGGTITQSQQLRAGAVTLGGTGDYQLTNGSNAIGALGGVAGSVSITDRSNLTLGRLQATTVVITDPGRVGGGPVLATNLLLQGQGSGGFSLTDVGNAISTLAANGIGGGLSVTDAAPLALGNVGGVSGIQANSDVTLTADQVDLSHAPLNAGNHTVTIQRLTPPPPKAHAARAKAPPVVAVVPAASVTPAVVPTVAASPAVPTASLDDAALGWNPRSLGSPAIPAASNVRWVMLSAAPWGRFEPSAQTINGQAFGFGTRLDPGLTTAGDLLVYASAP